jgi:DNA primase large subunit
MDAYHARYPFLDTAREAVEAADVALADLVAADHAVVERGHERVERALVEGSIETDRRVTPRTELLSYPIARVLVSLLDTPGAVEKYAAAEAETAHMRFVEDCERGREKQTRTQSDQQTLTLESLLQEFNLNADVQAIESDDRYRIAVATYLQCAPEDDDWTLVTRELSDGYVSVSRSEVLTLLRETVEERVVTGLPFTVPSQIAEPLLSTVQELKSVLASVEYPRKIDRIEPDLFPDCITRLIEQARTDDAFDPQERFTLVSFLAAIGMNAGDIRDFCGKHGDSFTYATERLAGADEENEKRGNPYPPPSFETMQRYGICEEDHDHTHPLEEYAAQLSTSEEIADN